ncbi:Aste57867_4970 [Aphanomyces stellatus]|uniref:Aste57867_4970 protein n=1 Tax=Aphanomyces stellatus TaxID=120398 RepID=A0A485KDJ5_9STRA|nr:hypothetical protein As57867_004957 [Aphanomyces stellatus]VFT82058.1 Aste57867_4970 [Aphanomyces stellatus]
MRMIRLFSLLTTLIAAVAAVHPSESLHRIAFLQNHPHWVALNYSTYDDGGGNATSVHVDIRLDVCIAPGEDIQAAALINDRSGVALDDDQAIAVDMAKLVSPSDAAASHLSSDATWLLHVMNGAIRGQLSITIPVVVSDAGAALALHPRASCPAAQSHVGRVSIGFSFVVPTHDASRPPSIPRPYFRCAKVVSHASNGTATGQVYYDCIMVERSTPVAAEDNALAPLQVDAHAPSAWAAAAVGATALGVVVAVVGYAARSASRRKEDATKGETDEEEATDDESIGEEVTVDASSPSLM